MPKASAFFFQEVLFIANTEYQINEDIRDKEVRLIGEEGEQMGILSVAQALEIAYSKNLDLVKIAPGSNPPVCKIMDYGKYRFAQAKRDKEAKKNQHIIEIKEIRMSPRIGDNDFSVKLKNAQKFLTDGDRVKVTVRFRGREMAHTNIGEELLIRFAEECSEISVLDKQPKLEGRNMSMFISPKVQAPPKKASKPTENAKREPKEDTAKPEEEQATLEGEN
ncbi:MAG: translation initiation factor IF-3 [Clostridia bacterium]|nr:translation initiation factor IF-3 [Clostridia bacterium]